MPTTFPSSVSLITTPVQTNTYFLSDQLSSTVTAIGGDRFVVTWMSWQQDGSSYGVFGQVLDSQLRKVGEEFQVDTYEVGNQRDQSVTALPDGGFVVVWESSADSGVWMRTYAQNGAPSSDPIALGVAGESPIVSDVGGDSLLVAWNGRDSFGSSDVLVQTVSIEDFSQSNPVLVNSYDQGRQEVTSVTALSDGRYFVLWSSFDQDGSDYGVYGRFVDATGTVVGDAFRINTDVAGSQEGAAAVEVPGIGLVVAWSNPDSSSSTLNTKIISVTDGSTISENQLPGVFGARSQLEIGVLNDGTVLIAWGIQSNGVMAVLFDPETNTASDVLTLSQQGRGAFEFTIEDHGNVVLTWSEEGFDGDGFGIQTARLALAEPALDPEYVLGTDQNDSLSAGDGDDIFEALGGDDVVEGNGGDDQILAGAGQDTAVYSGNQSSYTLTLTRTETTIEDRRIGGNGTDTLSSIEFLDFATDLTGSPFDLQRFGGTTGLAAQDFETFIELYIALFNRAPDAVGLNFWGTAFANGTTLREMTTLFFDQDETRFLYPENFTNAEFVETVYRNVLGREYDQDGFDFWVPVLDDDSNGIGRDTFIFEFLSGVQPSTPDEVYLQNKVDLGAYFAVHRGMSDVDNATAAMALFDGTQSGIDQAVVAIDGFYQEALDSNSGQFFLQVVGVLDNQFV